MSTNITAGGKMNDNKVKEPCDHGILYRNYIFLEFSRSGFHFRQQSEQFISPFWTYICRKWDCYFRVARGSCIRDYLDLQSLIC